MRQPNSKILRRACQVACALAAMGAGMLVSSCNSGHTFSYAYVTSSPTTGVASVFTYNVNSSSGVFSPTNDAQFPAQVPGAVAAVVTPDGANLYVLYGATTIPQTGLPANNGQHSIVHYGIRPDDGDITALDTSETGGTEPVGLAIDPSGNYLYAIDTYQPGFSNGSPGPGDVTIFQLVNGVPSVPASCPLPGLVTAEGNGCYYPVGFGPRGVTATPSATSPTYVYVANSGNTATPVSGTCYGTVSGFSLGADGTLTALNLDATAESCVGGGAPYPSNSLPLGENPWGIAAAVVSGNPSPYLYVTDYGAGVVYTVTTSAGIPQLAQNQTQFPFSTTGGEPENVLAGPQAGALFVSNFQQNTVTSFAIGSTGQLSGGVNNVTGAGPTCMAIDPSGMYFYVTNYLNGNVSGFALVDTATGQLAPLEREPFIVGSANTSNPTCVAIAPKPGS
jgi:DNA-binding beta-propeller fold protein YncE